MRAFPRRPALGHALLEPSSMTTSRSSQSPTSGGDTSASERAEPNSRPGRTLVARLSTSAGAPRPAETGRGSPRPGPVHRLTEAHTRPAGGRSRHRGVLAGNEAARRERRINVVLSAVRGLLSYTASVGWGPSGCARAALRADRQQRPSAGGPGGGLRVVLAAPGPAPSAGTGTGSGGGPSLGRRTRRHVPAVQLCPRPAHRAAAGTTGPAARASSGSPWSRLPRAAGLPCAGLHVQGASSAHPAPGQRQRGLIKVPRGVDPACRRPRRPGVRPVHRRAVRIVGCGRQQLPAGEPQVWRRAQRQQGRRREAPGSPRCRPPPRARTYIMSTPPKQDRRALRPAGP
ncbi:hypothetical protein GA0115254_103518 [Streptomyces sp. Ncost-T10-10d]|nr:hypothetical protein GA0115254_103518 [Streptomyces sp. Ncost-T10-10d]